jgi:flagellar protein FlaG
MATQSITNVALQGGVIDTRSGNSAGKVAVPQRQTFAVDVTGVQAQANNVELSQEALEKAVTKMASYIQNTQRDMDFSVDEVTGRVVVRVIDSDSAEVISQIPSEEMLAIARHLSESLENEEPKGFLIELKA